MFTLALGFHATERNVFFASKEEADAALAALKTKMGGKRYDENGERQRTHAIASPTGEVVVDLEKLECARVIDNEAHEALVADVEEKAVQKQIALRVRMKRADAEVAS